ncbi:hypothetical protein [uncultured Winogradskyella sp.]|uniref:hypothetical protein n=1 Tax=uncultured Winogradskyella sp. TaxID=395353 RepID=UPI0026259C14|nr:hypothetical protein [uncultured Winogradskyella sp.]
MKIFKKGILILLTAVFTFNFSYSQEKEKEQQPTMFVVHTDNVKFEMMPKYEEISKKFKTVCEENDIKDMTWTTISVEDGRYVYVSPITNMADLDKNPMESLAKKIGEEEMKKMFDGMDECYDSHSDAIVHFMPELSYMPEGYNTQDKNQREYHFLYYSPKNGKEMKEAMAKVKEMFETKGVKNGYEVYHSGFGSDENYFMVSIAGTSDVAIAQGGEENDKILGDERKATFWNVIKLTTKYDQVEASIRPDLSYYPSNE